MSKKKRENTIVLESSSDDEQDKTLFLNEEIVFEALMTLPAHADTSFPKQQQPNDTQERKCGDSNCTNVGLLFCTEFKNFDPIYVKVLSPWGEFRLCTQNVILFVSSLDETTFFVCPHIKIFEFVVRFYTKMLLPYPMKTTFESPSPVAKRVAKKQFYDLLSDYSRYTQRLIQTALPVKVLANIVVAYFLPVL